ncbi:MAG: thrombospondin type 3 repeat-containing protein, partial [Deltaproteobacteria bacterium]|nr:thrombospondin type 3 repeat-containing protein [Deltaproteobacteria bacterium]
FNDGGLALVEFDSRNLDRPHPLLPSRFGAPETLAATEPSGPLGAEGQPGPMFLHANTAGGAPAGDVYFATGSPNSLLVRGALSGALADPNGDEDSDGVQDAVDVCPLTADAAQLDAGSVGPSMPPDGVGDACQCGDVDGDGEVLTADGTALRVQLAGGALLVFAEKCDVSGDGACTIVDAARIARGVAGAAPGGVAQTCAPALP